MKDIKRPELGRRRFCKVRHSRTGQVGYVSKEYNDSLVDIEWDHGGVSLAFSVNRLVFVVESVEKPKEVGDFDLSSSKDLSALNRKIKQIKKDAQKRSK